MGNSDLSVQCTQVAFMQKSFDLKIRAKLFAPAIAFYLQ